MTNPVVHAFFVGRAVAQGISEQLEKAATNARNEFLSELGKFDAEQRERFRDFASQVMERANEDAAHTVPVSQASPAPGTSASTDTDLQEMIDTLRAEIAELRAKLQQYRDRNS